MLRWWLSFLVVFAVLLASLTTLISLVLKQVEPFISRLPSNITLMMELKTWFPLLPKRLLLRYTIYWYLLPRVYQLPDACMVALWTSKCKLPLATQFLTWSAHTKIMKYYVYLLIPLKPCGVCQLEVRFSHENEL
jgi:hypothetical protein